MGSCDHSKTAHARNRFAMNAHHDDAPIGVFDSGVGGLSVLHAIRRELPDENLLYAADSGNAPYGERDADFIRNRAVAMTRFLLAAHAKTIVVACNTATLVAVQELRSWCPVPVVAMEPAIKPAAQSTRSGVVGVLATRQTLASAGVARLCAAHGDQVRFLLQPCPGLVEQVERADLTSTATRALLRGYLSPLLAAGADTLVLGCTHYPFLLQLIREIAGDDILIIDSAAAVAREVARRLGVRRSSMPPGSAVTRFFSSASPAVARVALSALWGESVTVHPVGPDPSQGVQSGDA
jgi:glutamate racemase